jgi:hypothetical protein
METNKDKAVYDVFNQKNSSGLCPGVYRWDQRKV